LAVLKVIVRMLRVHGMLNYLEICVCIHVKVSKLQNH